MIIVGIDPGNTGAISVFANDRHVRTIDMPVITEKKKTQINLAEVAEIIDDADPGLAIVESVHAMPGQGVTSMFNFGKGYGGVLGVLAAIGVRRIDITPQEWKKAAGLIGKPKDASRLKAIDLFGKDGLTRKKDHGRADAMLIAYFGQKYVIRNKDNKFYKHR